MKEKKPQAEIILFRTEDEKLRLSVLFEDETVWLTQEQMAALFEKGRTTITEHIRNIFEEGELDEKVVCRKFRHTTQHGAIEGKTQTVSVKYYNLDVIISVGYRVKSLRGTQFRQWATQRLREYIINIQYLMLYLGIINRRFLLRKFNFIFSYYAMRKELCWQQGHFE